MTYMLKMTIVFIETHKAGPHICLLLLSLFTVSFSYTAFVCFIFKKLRIVFMSKVWQYKCILSMFG